MELRKNTFPTPLTRDRGCSEDALFRKDGKDRLDDLSNFVKYGQKYVYPTPTTQESEHPNAELTDTGRRKTGTGDSHSLNLADTVKFHSFPTPGTRGSRNGSGNCEKANTLAKEGVLTEEERVAFRAGNGGQLNPDWVEWLMDWVVGWTDLKPMSKESMDDWQYRVSNCQWNEQDPAELPEESRGHISRLTEDRTHRADRLKAIGNGQVPLCVYFATEILQEIIIREVIYGKEPKQKLMTNRQLAEWLARGNGEVIHKGDEQEIVYFANYYYYIDNADKTVNLNDYIRPWGSNEWIVPTVDIYEHDCGKLYTKCNDKESER